MACVPSEFLCWFCCLRSVERRAFRILAPDFVITGGAGVPLAIWETIWVLDPDDSAEARAAYVALYHLEYATVELEGVPIEVVRPLTEFLFWWFERAIDLLLPDAACSGGCLQSRVNE